MSHLRLVHSAPGPAVEPAPWRLTSRDLLTLTQWPARACGYTRMLVEPGAGGSTPEDGGYVLLYRDGATWAEWGLTRTGDVITAWRCATGADRGHYPTMEVALMSLAAAPRHREVPVPRRVALR